MSRKKYRVLALETIEGIGIHCKENTYYVVNEITNGGKRNLSGYGIIPYKTLEEAAKGIAKDMAPEFAGVGLGLFEVTTEANIENSQIFTKGTLTTDYARRLDSDEKKELSKQLFNALGGN